MKRRVLLSAIIIVLVSVVLVFASSQKGEEAYTKLMEGNKRFVSGNLMQKDLGDARRKELAKGQHPFAIVVTCSDSRVSPEIIFDQGLGELFVVRVAGNVVDSIALGSIEYAA
ncbi:MAG: carbonic anhydrase, partial [Candidatus Nitrosotenuis sp.]